MYLYAAKRAEALVRCYYAMSLVKLPVRWVVSIFKMHPV